MATPRDIPIWLRTLLNLVSILGVAAAFLGWVQWKIGVIFLAVAALYLIWELSPWLRQKIQGRLTISLILSIMIGAAVGAAIWLFLYKSRNPESTPTEQAATPKQDQLPPTLRQLFDSGWPELPAVYNIGVVRNQQLTSKEVPIVWRVEGDFVSRSRFLAFYVAEFVPPSDAVAALEAISKCLPEFLNAADSQLDIIGRMPSDTHSTHFRDMVFSKRVYVYYDNADFSLSNKASVDAVYQALDVSILFRDATFAYSHRSDQLEVRAAPLTTHTFLLPDAKKSEGLHITVTNLSKPATAERQK